MTYLFAHVSWMPSYTGDAGEPVFSTHGWVVSGNDAHERWNFVPVGDTLYGYVPIRAKQDAPGEIHIERFGVDKRDSFVDDITLIWFANDPENPKLAYVVGWYRNARVYREAHFQDMDTLNAREFRISCADGNQTLLSENARKFLIPHSRSKLGMELGYGYGQSSLWYASDASQEFLDSIEEYINTVDQVSPKDKMKVVPHVADAINDLDDDGLGAENPDRRQNNGFVIVRDPRVRKRVIKRARGRCEYCGELGFQRPDGSHFIEAHHILSLAKQGPDTLKNVIALCASHHREAHFGKNSLELEQKFLIILKAIIGVKTD